MMKCLAEAKEVVISNLISARKLSLSTRRRGTRAKEAKESCLLSPLNLRSRDVNAAYLTKIVLGRMLSIQLVKTPTILEDLSQEK